MKLTIQHIFDATPVLNGIKNDNRPIPAKGKYRISRMLRAIQPEWELIAERYNVMVRAYDNKRPMINGERVEPTAENLANPNCVMQDAVPDDKWQEFVDAWKVVGAEEVEVAVEPIPLDQLCIDGREDGITIAEFSVLDTLVDG